MNRIAKKQTQIKPNYVAQSPSAVIFLQNKAKIQARSVSDGIVVSTKQTQNLCHQRNLRFQFLQNKANSLDSDLGQFHRPVGMVEELLPAFVAVVVEVQMNDRIAFGLDGFLDERHVRLVGRHAAFSGVAFGAGTDNVFPFACPAQRTRDDMVEREFICGELLAAVLTAVAVAGKEITSVKLDGLTRQAVIKQQTNDPRHGDIEIDGGNPVVTGSFKGFLEGRQLPPGIEIVIAPGAVIAGNDFGQVTHHQRHCSPYADDAEGHIVLVKNKYLRIQNLSRQSGKHKGLLTTPYKIPYLSRMSKKKNPMKLFLLERHIALFMQDWKNPFAFCDLPSYLIAMSNRSGALHIIKCLRQNGFTALLAGGCVRDMLLGLRASDYDVATNAVPEQIVRLFRRTLKIGAKFGVVMVLLDDKQIEVATFRTEGGYADGRHPEHVEFATARQDALRRDFTINGMFYDPIERRVLDFVGGQEDLKRQAVHTIGTAQERFGEDYLRMLRAVRFAAKLDFEIEKKTWTAIRELAGRITRISAERIAAELENILTHPNRKHGAQLLCQSGLAGHIFANMTPDEMTLGTEVLGCLGRRIDWPLGLAAFFAGMETSKAIGFTETLKPSTAVTKHLRFLLEKRTELLDSQIPLAQLKMLLAAPYFWDLYDLQTAIQKAAGRSTAALKKIKHRALALKGVNLCPKPLLDGHELIAMGAMAGPMVGRLSREMYIAQLAEEITTPAQASQWVMNWLKIHLTTDP
jgi:poly(A) polymerase